MADKKRTGSYRKSHSPEYTAWVAIKQRCYNPKHDSYPQYGGRGIAMFEPWKESYDLFLEHVGRRPYRGYSIDRIDTNVGYFPGNLRWASASQQQRNRRDNMNLTFDGETKLVRDWAKQLGISITAINGRLKKGWSPERTLTEAVNTWKTRYLTAAGTTLSLTEWSAKTGINKNTIRGRLSAGWPAERALGLEP